MEPTSLTQFYDDLKKMDSTPSSTTVYNVKPTPTGAMGPGAIAWRNRAINNCNALKDQCRQHIILDIYTKVLPLDQDYIDGNRGMMANDISNMLGCKNMTASQYLTSCSEATHAPLVDYLLWATDKIGENYMKEAQEDLNKAQEVDAAKAPEPKEPDTNDDEVQQQLVDIKQDPEYTNFIDKLKEKTVKKIVADISTIIADKKEENDMTFDTSGEEPSAESVEFTEGKNVPTRVKFKSQLRALVPFSKNPRPGTIRTAAKKLVDLDKSIYRDIMMPLSEAIKKENSNRGWGDKITNISEMAVKLGDDEKVHKTSSMLNTSTRTAAKRFIKSLINEYKNAGTNKWSSKSRIWIQIMYIWDGGPNDYKYKDKIVSMTNEYVKNGLKKYVDEGIIKVDKADINGAKTSKTDSKHTTVGTELSKGTYTSSTTTDEWTEFTITYTVHLNLQYIFENISEYELMRYAESVEFDDTPRSIHLNESPLATAFDYMVENMWTKDTNVTDSLNDEMLGLAIREATLHELDCVFKQPRSNFNEYASSIRYNKGYAVNQNACKALLEKYN